MHQKTQRCFVAYRDFRHTQNESSNMRTHPKAELCLPLIVFAVFCAASIPTLIVALCWMMIGLIAIGHRSFESYRVIVREREWKNGYRAVIVGSYHIACWPTYTRKDLRRMIRRTTWEQIRVSFQRFSAIATRTPYRHMCVSQRRPCATSRFRSHHENARDSSRFGTRRCEVSAVSPGHGRAIFARRIRAQRFRPIRR